jgi:hypothetical protein
MAVHSWLSLHNLTTDANFRAWGSAISSAFATLGLVKTNDTGQINWTTAVRVAGVIGYEIWRYPDSSVFFKIEYGMSNGGTGARLWLTVGQGSNGSGTITGTQSPTGVVVGGSGSTAADDTISTMSFMCFKDNFLGVSINRRNSNSSMGFFCIAPTTDSSGAVNSIGVTVYRSVVSIRLPLHVQALNFQAGVAFPVNTSGAYCLIPQGSVLGAPDGNTQASSLTNGDFQCYAHWTAMPRVYPVMQMCSVLNSEVPIGSVFQTTIVGSQPRSYMALDDVCPGTIQSTTLNYVSSRCAMLWE